MIRIEKPAESPEVLTVRGAEHNAELCAAFERDEKPGGFRNTIYAHDSVKAALKGAQHGKCCFCERRIGDDGDVEHFRPKGGWKQAAGNPTSAVGYFWLAYEWANLLLCCSDCNSRHKLNLFPLSDPTQRADPALRDVSAEDPLFINPSERDPADCIGFREEYAYPIDGNPYGATTIDELGLNSRENIVADRRDFLQTVQTLRRTITALESALLEQFLHPQNEPLVRKIRGVISDSLSHLSELTSPTAPFTGMISAILPRGEPFP